MNAQWVRVSADCNAAISSLFAAARPMPRHLWNNIARKLLKYMNKLNFRCCRSSGAIVDGIAVLKWVSLGLLLHILSLPLLLAQGTAGASSSFDGRLQPQENSRSIATAFSTSTVGLTTSMEVLNDTARLGIGDRVSFRIIEEEDPPIGLIVTDSGEMEVPLIGRVLAKGKTCKELAYALKPILEKEYFYHATVILGIDGISSRSRGKIYITGQVRAQGPLDLPADEVLTVSKAIMRAGGLADFANKAKVKLTRKKSDGQTQTTLVNLVEVIDKGKDDKDPVLEPGDVIIVTERLINF